MSRFRIHSFMVALLLSTSAHSAVGSTQLYWGDSHLHTSFSLDAALTGTILGPEEAYRFARGEEVKSNLGLTARLSRPLDWLVVTDHSEALGVMNLIAKGDENLLKDPLIKQWSEQLSEGGAAAQSATMDIAKAMVDGKLPALMNSDQILVGTWRDSIKAAEAFNSPGQFTALIGYEWTSTPEGNNLHRNVIYRDGEDKAGKLLPFTVAEGDRPWDLWQWMARYEAETSGRLLAIPHNGNLSNGWMFPIETNPMTGEAIDIKWLAERARWEPLYEVTQMKGDGEAHPFLSPQDEFADFETWDNYNLGMTPKEPFMLRYEYAREALKSGLKIEAALDVNPYQFGLVGSTDSHTALATAEENNFFGKLAYLEPSPQRMSQPLGEVDGKVILGWEVVASGYTGVWAESNTREAIFDAMMRREVYATTGPRIVLRFFGGWNFTPGDLQGQDFVEHGYRKGVPMGGTLEGGAGQDERSPGFLIAVMKDPEGARLDRIQIVKAWLDSEGEVREQIYDVSCSDERAVDNRRCADKAQADSASSLQGAESLSVHWVDPEFSSSQAALYYVRAIQVPSPRWNSHDAERFSEQSPDSAPTHVRDRAYSSPIWYQP